MSKFLEAIDLGLLATRLVEYLPSVASAALILVGFWIAFRLTRGPLRRLLDRASIQRALARMLVDNIYRTAMFALGLVMALSQLGIDVAAALAGIGVVGLAFGLAAQDSLANFIAGFLIFWDKPFLDGDWVTVVGQYGKVTEITMRSTRIRTNKNTYVVVPNRKIIDEVLVNHSKHGEARVDVPLGIAYKEDIRQARDVLLAAVRGIETISANHPTAIVVTELGSSSVNLEVRVWIDDAADEAPTYVAVMESAKLALDAAGIQIPYPHLQLFVEDVDPRVLGRLTDAGALPAANVG